jgi:hypothetical protein
MLQRRRPDEGCVFFLSGDISMPIKTFINSLILGTSGNTVVHKSLAWYVAMMEAGRIFSFSRYGDGEWNAMIGTQGENCDGHRFFPELGGELRSSVVRRRGYIYALQPRAIRCMRSEIQGFLASNHVSLAWHNADVFHDANKRGKLFHLISTLRSMDVVLIGPAPLRAIKDNVFPYRDFIEIPSRDCYLAKDEIIKRVLKSAEVHAHAVFAFSASMTAKVLIYELFPVIGAANWLIDFGSLWDIYVGIKSRNVYNKLDWEKIMRRNLNP